VQSATEEIFIKDSINERGRQVSVYCIFNMAERQVKQTPDVRAKVRNVTEQLDARTMERDVTEETSDTYTPRTDTFDGAHAAVSTDITALFALMQQQLREERKLQERCMQAEREQHQQQINMQRQQMKDLLARLAPGQTSTPPVATPTPSYAAFDPSSELWEDYWACFQTFCKANSVPQERQPQVFLVNQTKATYKLISTLEKQMATPKEVNDLTMKEIVISWTSSTTPRNSSYGSVSSSGRTCYASQGRKFKNWPQGFDRMQQNATSHPSRINKMKPCGHGSSVQSAMKRF